MAVAEVATGLLNLQNNYTPAEIGSMPMDHMLR